MCPARICAERNPAGYGGDVSGHVCAPLACAQSAHPAGYDGDVGGHACVPLAVRREHPAGYGGDVGGRVCVPLTKRGVRPCKVQEGRERARMRPARDVHNAPPPATAGT